MKKRYLILTANKYKAKDLQGKYTINGRGVLFIPDTDMPCLPPIIKGKLDSTWIKYRGKLNVYNKKECEKKIGIPLQPIPNDILKKYGYQI